MNNKGFALVPVIIIAAAFCVGAIAYVLTKKNDSPIEQAAEAVLHSQGIDVDFSPDDEDEQDYD